MDTTYVIAKALRYYAEKHGDSEASQVLDSLQTGGIMVVDNLVDDTNDALKQVASETNIQDADSIRRMVRICSRITSSERSVINSIVNARTKHAENIHNVINGRY